MLKTYCLLCYKRSVTQLVNEQLRKTLNESIHLVLMSERKMHNSDIRRNKKFENWNDDNKEKTKAHRNLNS